MKAKHPVLHLCALLLFMYTVNASYVRLPSGDGACDGMPSSIEWVRTGRDFCQKDVQSAGGTFWECQGGSVYRYKCDSPSCEGECKEVPVVDPCPTSSITCAPTFEFAHQDHFPGTVVYYKNSDCAGEGRDVLKIQQKLACEQTASSCTKDEDESYREFCGTEFTADLVDYDEEFHIVGHFASSATQRAQLVLVGFVVLDLLLCYAMI